MAQDMTANSDKIAVLFIVIGALFRVDVFLVDCLFLFDYIFCLIIPSF